MSVTRSTGLKNHLLSTGSYTSALEEGFIYIFSDPTSAGVPLVDAAASDATYPLVAKISSTSPAAANGADGLDFETAANGILAKATAETWQAIVDVVGSGSPSSTQTPTFARFVAAADVATVRSASTTAKRLQFTVGGPASDADVILEQSSYVDNGTNEIAINAFQIRLAS